MANHYTVTTIRDRSRELSRVKVYNGAITAASLPGFLTEYGALKTALAGITLGVVAKDQWVGDATDLDDSVPTDPFAQREIGLRVHYVGNTNNKSYFITVAAPKLASLTYIGNTDEVLLADGSIMAAFVTAFETIARSPDDDTETVTVTKAEVVGRNN